MNRKGRRVAWAAERAGVRTYIRQILDRLEAHPERFWKVLDDVSAGDDPLLVHYRINEMMRQALNRQSARRTRVWNHETLTTLQQRLEQALHNAQTQQIRNIDPGMLEQLEQLEAAKVETPEDQAETP